MTSHGETGLVGIVDCVIAEAWVTKLTVADDRRITSADALALTDEQRCHWGDRVAIVNRRQRRLVTDYSLTADDVVRAAAAVQMAHRALEVSRPA